MMILRNNFLTRPFDLIGQRVFLFAFCFVSGISFGQQFQVDGNIRYNSWEPNGDPVQEISSKFSLCVSNCCWEMVVTPPNNFGIDYFKLTYDGTQLYLFENTGTAVSEMVKQQKAAGKALPAEINFGVGIVVNSEIPHDPEVDGAGQIWLSYASSCYFKEVKTNKLEIPYVWGGVRKRPVMLNAHIMRRASWTIQPQPPELPSNISYLSDGGDFTNGLYKVDSYTNYQNIIVPLESTFEVFNRTDGSSNIFLQCRYIVKTTNVNSFSGKIIFPPLVPVLTSVVDCRFSGQQQLPYNVSERFLSKEEAKDTPYYNSAILNNPALKAKATIRGNNGKIFVLVVMAGTTIIFFLIVTKKWRRKLK